jgi:hypothetical protein
MSRSSGGWAPRDAPREWAVKGRAALQTGFTARTYAHVMRDASKRRRVPIARAIVAARRRPLVDPSAAEPGLRTDNATGKALQIEEADARIRTADPFITSEVLYQLSYVGARLHSIGGGRADSGAPCSGAGNAIVKRIHRAGRAFIPRLR